MVRPEVIICGVGWKWVYNIDYWTMVWLEQVTMENIMDFGALRKSKAVSHCTNGLGNLKRFVIRLG